MKTLRRVLVACSALAVVWLALCLVAGITAAEIALHPSHRGVNSSDTETARNIAAYEHANLKSVSVTADDGARLLGWEFDPLRKNGDAVLLLHGQSDNRAGMLGSAVLLLSQGYTVLLPDARAHGESGGPVAAYGILERRDISDWVALLRTTEGIRCIDGLGDSMGAAQLLQSLETVPEFCAVVAESSFADFREAAFDRMGQQFGTGPWLGRTLLRPAVEAGFLYSRIRYGIDLALAAPDRIVPKSRVPVLLIHGRMDTNLPPRHSEKIFAMSHPLKVDLALWEPSNAGHCSAASADPVEYKNRVLLWFATHGRGTQPQENPLQLQQ